MIVKKYMVSARSTDFTYSTGSTGSTGSLIYMLFTLFLASTLSLLCSPVEAFSKYDYTSLQPRTPNQGQYMNALNKLENQLVIGLGPAGCGKTLFACQAALQELKSKNIDKIIITRPLISVEKEDLGFLPGKMHDKMDPWTRPIIDVLNDLLNKELVTNMILTNTVELSPLAYMRGRTFKNAFIIADEMQNSSPTQMQMLITRIGEGSKMVINGDLQQSDYKKNIPNGLFDLMNRIEKYDKMCISVDDVADMYDARNKIEIVKMKDVDIQRSPIVSRILKIYNDGNEI